jgi:DNA-binding response OmpR family regulator
MARVVIAEDDRTLREMLVVVLEGAGYEVSAHEDGRAAVAAVEQQKPDAVLLDVSMPVMSGLEAARALRDSRDSATVPILLLTAHGQWVDVSDGFEAGADDYVTKPFSPQDLIHRIEALLAA